MDLEDEVTAVTLVLAQRHQAFAVETIARLVRRTFDAYTGATVTLYLPLLVQREVETRLRALDHDFTPRRPATDRPTPAHPATDRPTPDRPAPDRQSPDRSSPART